MEECAELYRHYLANPDARRAITERARQRILKEHTYAHRLEKIAGIMRARYAD